MTGTNARSVQYPWPQAPDGGEAPPPVLRAVPTHIGEQAVLTLAGAIDLTTAGCARMAAVRCLQQQPASLALDLCPLTFCDCAGARTMEWIARQAACAHVGFRLIGVPPRIRRMLTLIGADDLLAAAAP